MVNPLPVVTTVPTDTWVDADWEDFLTFADDPILVSGRFYYDQGQMRIEMAPLSSAHGQDNSIISTVIVLYATVKLIPIKELTNTTFRKTRVQEAQRCWMNRWSCQGWRSRWSKRRCGALKPKTMEPLAAGC